MTQSVFKLVVKHRGKIPKYGLLACEQKFLFITELYLGQWPALYKCLCSKRPVQSSELYLFTNFP